MNHSMTKGISIPGVGRLKSKDSDRPSPGSSTPNSLLPSPGTSPSTRDFFRKPSPGSSLVQASSSGGYVPPSLASVRTLKRLEEEDDGSQFIVFTSIYEHSSGVMRASHAVGRDQMTMGFALTRNILTSQRNGIISAPDGQKMIVKSDMGECYCINFEGLFYCGIFTQGYPRRVAFHFLEKLLEEVSVIQRDKVKRKASAYGSMKQAIGIVKQDKRSKKFQKVLDRLCRTFDDLSKVDSIYSTLKQVSEVKVMAYDIIEKAVMNMEDFQALQAKATTLEDSSSQFERNAKAVKTHVGGVPAFCGGFSLWILLGLQLATIIVCAGCTALSIFVGGMEWKLSLILGIVCTLLGLVIVTAVYMFVVSDMVAKRVDKFLTGAKKIEQVGGAYKRLEKKAAKKGINMPV